MNNFSKYYLKIKFNIKYIFINYFINKKIMNYHNFSFKYFLYNYKILYKI